MKNAQPVIMESPKKYALTRESHIAVTLRKHPQNAAVELTQGYKKSDIVPLTKTVGRR